MVNVSKFCFARKNLERFFFVVDFIVFVYFDTFGVV